MVSEILAVDRSPEDVTSDTERHYLEHSDDDDEERSSEEGEEAESCLSYEAPRGPRTKAEYDPSVKACGVQQLTASGRTTRRSKRAWTKAESSPEKQPKLPKQISSKPRKATVPWIKVAVPMAST